jgi:monoamine oxidase
MRKQKIAIVGAGLAGVYAAYRLHKAGIDFDLFEARNRLGGRIHSTEGGLDLGPAWFWPDFQPHMHGLVAELGLSSFAQHEQGDALLERGLGQLMRRQGYPSGNLSMRIGGGTIRLIDALAANLPTDCIHLNTQVLAATLDETGIALRLSAGYCEPHSYSHIWLAIPPRLASRIAFAPQLSQGSIGQLCAVPTWMAAHAKYVARYSQPFWREQKLSGDAFSTVGPLGEIHDASNGEAAALFGFFAIDAARREQFSDAELRALCRTQLIRLFGEKAGTPLEDRVQDWAADPLTATAADQTPPRWHSLHDLTKAFERPWVDRLALVGSEAGGEQGGYMEGALLAVDATLQRVLELPSTDIAG